MRLTTVVLSSILVVFSLVHVTISLSFQTRVLNRRPSFVVNMVSTKGSTISIGGSYSSSNKRFHPNLRGVFVGSGSDGMADPRIADTILGLLISEDKNESLHDATLPPPPPDPKNINVLYIGTATYDLDIFRRKQTQCFIDRGGCNVDSLNVALTTPPKETIQKLFENAHIIIVGGGNTLYAIDKWIELDLLPYFQKAMERGTILTGGSAGAICWFDGGHSDSMDPETYMKPMTEKHRIIDTTATKKELIDESSTLKEGDIAKDWKYIRVHGLGFLPGLVCPHHDRIQSNGILRAHDFDQMLLRHPEEIGIGIDHWAALIVVGEDYKILSLEGKKGSFLPGRENKFGVDGNGNPLGIPGIWIKKVDSKDPTKIQARRCPPEGKVRDILQVPITIMEDVDAIEQCRRANPS